MHAAIASGYDIAMSTYDKDQLEAVQAVVDRVSAYQDGAPETTVASELRDGFAESGVTVEDADVERLADAIESNDGDVSAEEVLA